MIPILINNRDLLEPVKKLVAFFLKVPNTRIILADNASTYPPLIEWYRNECPVDVIHMGGNYGPRGSLRFATPNDEYFFCCEPDLDFTGVPYDFLEHLQAGLWEHGVQSAGLSLRIDDVPAFYNIDIERKYWTKPLGDNFYSADCDMAGILRHRTWDGGYAGIRSRLYQIRHLPWYHVDECSQIPSCTDRVVSRARQAIIRPSALRREPLCPVCEQLISHPTAKRRPADFEYYLTNADHHGTYYTQRTLAGRIASQSLRDQQRKGRDEDNRRD